MTYGHAETNLRTVQRLDSELNSYGIERRNVARERRNTRVTECDHVCATTPTPAVRTVEVEVASQLPCQIRQRSR